MSIPRRGYFAAGLAVAVVGSLGVISTLNAGADEVSEAPAAVVADRAPGGPTPPPELPWGDKPTPLKLGAPGASSRALAASGADIAPDPNAAVSGPQAEFGPKGYTSKKRTLRKSRTIVAPQPPLAEPAPATTAATATKNVHYHYAAGSQYVEADGSYANLVIGRPKLGDADYHSLAEIAVQSEDEKQKVEVGWTVDRGVNEGSEDPHLFVYHWVNDKGACYNACGFVPVGSGKTVVGGSLPYGQSKRFGIRHYSGAWWIAYDSEWIGYFPDRLWTDKKVEFTKSGLIQWFGEVASSRLEPCSEMGTGEPATSEAAARIGTISLIIEPEQTPALVTRTISPERESGYYPVEQRSERTFRYGGKAPTTC